MRLYLDDQTNPLLREFEEQEARAAEATPETVVPTEPVVPDAPAGLPAEEPSQSEPEPFYKINKASTYADLNRLAEEDPEFRNNLNSLIGRKARREYKPRIDELEAQLAQFNAQATIAARSVTDPEAVKERLLRDPEFRRQYDAPIPDPEFLRVKSALERSLDDVFDAVADVVPDEVVTTYREAIIGGHYDIKRDTNEQPVLGQDGQPILLSPYEALAQVTNAVNRQARYFMTQAAVKTAPASAPVASAAPAAVADRPVANPALAAVRPDISTPSGGAGAGVQRMSTTEYNNLTPPQQIALYRTGADLERALASGELYEG